MAKKGIGDSIKDLLDEITDGLKVRRNDAKTAAAIRKNTRALSKLSTHPPSKEPKMSETPGQSVEAALAEQTEAIATLSAELADEATEWAAAASAGDTVQADKIIESVKANTEKLKALSDELASSHPGSSTEPEVNPL